ncbi:Epsin-3, clathrin recruitment and traffic between the Golgi and endosome [Coemansia sp. RSA 2523]|nr:Epsin-3, clathrin recruitment and traffic between the Golgi and endosome [Coemansia sp. RSA 2523]KAJ2146053.1 Epsin-3, clathrin recruitment and traffic between the Golgi and endosome [Coemansia sp. RSA 564]KAJ2729978.1 Epsin-3, clathrin recruitment and traffic between the Golgi and endosome [Coemansia sp. D1744]
MDLNKLTDISAWDVRNVYNKVKNVVMNYSEIEIKVNEATSPDPWGASSTLMRELADASFNRKDFDDIMPMIYVKVNDTDPSNWRQVYKALQLIEYLIKNGSERVVDDVRGHMTIVKMLKSFHHIDANGKDQGVNVRHRSKEVVELINDSERLRSERNKAKDNRNKYNGFSGGSRMDGFGNSARGSSGRSTGFGSSSTSGGFGNSSTSGGFGSGGFGNSSSSRYGGLSSNDYVPSASRYDDQSDSASNNRSGSEGKSTPSTSSGLVSRKSTRQATPVSVKPAAPEVADLFSFDDDDVAPANNFSAAPTITSPAAINVMDSLVLPTPKPAANTKSATLDAFASFGTADDDDWGDFQGTESSANPPVSTSAPALSQPVMNLQTNAAAKTSSPNAMFDLLGGDAGLNFQPLPTSPPTAGQSASTLTSTFASAKPAQKGAFSDIWDVNSDILSLDSLSLANKNKAVSSKKQSASMNQLAGQNSPF